MRVCACPRKEPMTGMPLTAKYRHPDSCRKAAYRAKLKAKAEAAGLPVAPTLAAVERATRSSGRPGDAETPRKQREKRRPELRISYRKAVEVLTAAYAPAGHEDESRQFIEQTLSQVLPPRARAQIEQQRQEAA